MGGGDCREGCGREEGRIKGVVGERRGGSAGYDAV